MEKKSKRIVSLVTMMLLFFIVMAANFRGCFSAASQTPIKGKPTTPANDRVGSSVFFRVTGNVYPTGHYSVILNIGNPPKAFDLDIDTGSDLTWVQCDAPCKGCTKPLDKLYKPKNNRVPCASSLCQAISTGQNYNCDIPTEQCDYEVQYADLGSSLGVLLSDYFPLRLNNGSLLQPRIAFGCGYDQKYLGPHSPPDTAGILGLGRGKASILSQLRNLGITQNVVGHCFSRVTGGFLFFGDHHFPPSGITWTPMRRSSSDTLYSSGPAELLFGGKPTGIKGLQLIFDSGSSYTYFSAQVYQSILNLVRKDLSGKPLRDAPEEKALAVCWKTAKPIKSILDIKSFFKPLTINFIKAKNVQLQLAPEDYLIITKDGNVCLGILNGGEQGLGNLNVIGDIFMQDRVVVYDNERQQIGWFPTNCNRLPKS
ncbi:PREDICTED: aspartic proteinase Asp1-like isoform X2 [Populus euphratica]|uniref:Aspartic proteinase Asp1 n=1 Tax=Populus euphratica TaxID=75702 RepID=A0AAJ6XD63_POPEU|nr:PREDICTED: aspartic proteinase Asp1-like isoform X2 [Populus euphratica]XP_011027496.1 PREDICTED: aspartic proteinase Asp1-like isoform X2 [Populus euphratica]